MDAIASLPVWLLAPFVFLLCVCDVTLGTVRTVAIVRGPLPPAAGTFDDALACHAGLRLCLARPSRRVRRRLRALLLGKGENGFPAAHRPDLDLGRPEDEPHLDRDRHRLVLACLARDSSRAGPAREYLELLGEVSAARRGYQGGQNGGPQGQ